MNASRANRKVFLRRLTRVLAWAAVPVFIFCTGIGFWLGYQIGLSNGFTDVMLTLGMGACALIGSLLVARRPDNLISWIMITLGLMVVFPTAETYAAYVMTTRGYPDALAVLGVWFNEIYFIPLLSLFLIYLPLLFPDGHLPSRRWIPVALIPGIAIAVFAVFVMFRETLIGQQIKYQIDNPIGIEGFHSDDNTVNTILIGTLMIGLVGAVAAVFVRFRRSKGVERQQLKWFLFSVALLPVLPFQIPTPLLSEIMFGFVSLAIPVAIGVAILRYRLWDIDLIIRRTLQYALLTGLLALIYFGSVVLLENLVEKLTGQGSPLVIVISTLAIAALFNPLRLRVQSFIDRRFYRRKYDAEQALANFAAIVRDEVDLEKLSAALLEVVDETIQPERVSLSLKQGVR